MRQTIVVPLRSMIWIHEHLWAAISIDHRRR
jgi:hypothetical protein